MGGVVAGYGGGVAVTGTVDLGQSLAALMSLGADPSKGTNSDSSSSSSSNSSTKPEYKTAKSGVSGKEGAKDVPDWAKGNKPFKNENGKQFAKRLLNEKYGEGNYKTGPKTEYNQIQKWGDRSFE